MKVMVVAVHPDDETIGCGGTLLRHKENGDEIYWIIVTKISRELGYAEKRIQEREHEIEEVAKQFGIRKTFRLGYSTAHLDVVPLADLVEKIGAVFREVEPSLVYLPFPGDIHSDHRITFEAAIACTKWFRYPFVKKVLAFEAVSETEFNFNPNNPSFRPNYFVDISSYLEKKIAIAGIYASEMGAFPFPRSQTSINALAFHRGSIVRCEAAEAFMLLRETI